MNIFDFTKVFFLRLSHPYTYTEKYLLWIIRCTIHLLLQRAVAFVCVCVCVYVRNFFSQRTVRHFPERKISEGHEQDEIQK